MLSRSTAARLEHVGRGVRAHDSRGDDSDVDQVYLPTAHTPAGVHRVAALGLHRPRGGLVGRYHICATGTAELRGRPRSRLTGHALGRARFLVSGTRSGRVPPQPRPGRTGGGAVRCRRRRDGPAVGQGADRVRAHRPRHVRRSLRAAPASGRDPGVPRPGGARSPRVDHRGRPRSSLSSAGTRWPSCSS